MRSLVRHGDTMLAIESGPATIDFLDVLNATKVVADEYESMTPWEQCDGYEHTVTKANRMPNDADTDEMQGNVYWNGGRVVIQLPAKEDYGIYEYQRAQGASRQVAAEAVAAERRRTLAQLVKWYNQGWQWYGVRCKLVILGNEFADSVWGIDDPDYAEQEVVEEIANAVTRQLENAGYTVTGKPEAYRGPDRISKEAGLVRNLAAQNWAA